LASADLLRECGIVGVDAWPVLLQAAGGYGTCSICYPHACCRPDRNAALLDRAALQVHGQLTTSKCSRCDESAGDLGDGIPDLTTKSCVSLAASAGTIVKLLVKARGQGWVCKSMDYMSSCRYRPKSLIY
jgi:hypothetical protein